MKRCLIASMAAAAVAASLLCAASASADNAPMWESPMGLTPGAQTAVRMQAEDVSVQVVERGAAVFAIVNATFDMTNPGTTAQMLVGFPNFAGSALPAQDTYSPVMFTPANISNFRAWTDTANFSPSLRQVKTGPYNTSDWFVWNMSYPRGQTRVHVSYEQKLNEQSDFPWSRPIAHVSYVLRTGALWAGTIGSARVTFDAPNGGVLLGAERTVEATDTHVAWQFTDIKPTFDPDATYVYQQSWHDLQSAQAALTTGAAGPSDYLRAAQAALHLLGRDGPYSEPPALVERYARVMREWAWNGSQLDSAEAWEAVGDVEHYFAIPATKNHGEFACWPDAGAAAYDRAAELGSTTAAEKRADMDSTANWMRDTGYSGILQSC
jgi:hypothetical protein